MHTSRVELPKNVSIFIMGFDDRTSPTQKLAINIQQDTQVKGTHNSRSRESSLQVLFGDSIRGKD